MQLQHDVWYVCALPDQIDRQLKRRVIAGEPMLLYRSEAGALVALKDRCPHRFAPLSRGKLLGDIVQCGYHGLQFGTDGRCVFNPYGNVIAPNNRVRAYPTAERYGLSWVWSGDPDLCSVDKIPDLAYMTAPGHRTAHSYFTADYRYDILVDNLLDLSHAEYLHVGSFMSGTCERSETKVAEVGDELTILYTQFSAPAPPHLSGRMGDRVDQRFRIRWHPGQVITFELANVLPGGDFSDAPVIRFAHIATPETAGSTHYFISNTRDFDLDDAELDKELAARQIGVIQREDGPMLEAVDAEMDGADLLELRPVILPTDTGALRVRRLMKRLLAAETNSGPPMHEQPNRAT